MQFHVDVDVDNIRAKLSKVVHSFRLAELNPLPATKLRSIDTFLLPVSIVISSRDFFFNPFIAKIVTLVAWGPSSWLMYIFLLIAY